MGEYSVTWSGSMVLNRVTESAYFGGKKVLPAVARDRLGSARGNASAADHPYGENYPSVPWGMDGTDGFGAYYQDSSTRLNYADQRYYNATYGRFNTPDPYQAGDDGPESPEEPQSWNHYAYVLNDPITFYDPEGLMASCPPGTHVSADGHGCASDPPGPGGPVTIYKKTPVHTMPGEGGGGGGAGGGGGGSQANPDCNGVLTQNLQSFLQTNDAPLLKWDSNLATQLISAGALTGVDPRLMVSIMTLESGHGSSFTGNNPFGLGPGASFSSPMAALNYEASTLNKFIYTWKEGAVSALYSGNGFVVVPNKPWIVKQYPVGAV